MQWIVEVLVSAQAELEEMPDDIQASFLRTVDLIESRGLTEVHAPYVKHLEGRLWEMDSRDVMESHARSM